MLDTIEVVDNDDRGPSSESFIPEYRSRKAHISGFPHLSSASPLTERSPEGEDFDLKPSYHAALQRDL